MKKTLVPLAGIALASTLLAACGSDAEPSGSAGGDYPLTVDDCGTDVTLDARPEGVLTIGTAAISLLDAAGATDRIVARTAEFGAPLPDGLTTPPTDIEVLDPADPTAETIIGAGADLVYGYGFFNGDPAQVEQAGISTLTVLGECGHDADADGPGGTGFATVSDDVRRLGEVFGTQDVADASADALDARVAELAEAGAALTGSVAWLYYFSSEDALSGYGAGGMAQGVLSETGLENVFADESEQYLTVNRESLLSADPDYIVLSYGLYGESAEDARAQLLREPGLDALTAVREGRIILVPGTGSEPSPAAVAGLEAIVAAADAR